MINILASTSIAALVILGSISVASANDHGRHAWSEKDRNSGCDADVAIRKARAMGLRYNLSASVTPRYVIVSGLRERDPKKPGVAGTESVTFANLPGCP